MNQSLLPLKGKTVLVPRGKKEAEAFSTLVEQYGGVPMEIPLIAFRPIQSSKEIVAMFNNLHTYDWIIFTSNVTVETFFSFFKKTPAAIPQVAVIGEKTANVLREKGYGVQFIPNEYVAEGFAREFRPYVKKGMKVLIPKGNLSRDYIAKSLINAGALVDEIIIYETYLPEESKLHLKEAITNRQLDILTFTSPSTFDHFMEVILGNGLQRNIEHCLIACIGPVTKEKIESLGWKVDVSPETYTVENMLKDVILYIQAQN
ncbi:uroporphyrinogen-III synthase [Bacillus sp. CGMCC 1.16607]|uniref:uroporphyrinogen-III synthase n=1 Tax=Bacillus sp. CGMCC 1.16607 TaxID=3351842 RepID=UPI003643A6DE